MAWTGRIVLGVTALMVLIIVVVFAYRAFRQHQNAQSLAITTPDGIDEGAFVKIGGIEQWVHIRGEDKANPVILIVHGGPGSTLTALIPVFKAWEKTFTVVQWDQRGSGKTFSQNGKNGQGEMSIARMSADGIEVADYLRMHLHKNKVIVVGFSWGTVLGVTMVHERPDLFSAYVGTGQVVDRLEKEAYIYDATMKKAEAARNQEAIVALKKLGAPPYKTYDDLLIERHWSEVFDVVSERELESRMTPVVLFSPYYSPRDIYSLLTSPRIAGRATQGDMDVYDARHLGADFALPMFVFNGSEDAITPTPLAQKWFEGLNAPVKDFVVLPGGGHASLLTMSDQFLKELDTRVRPLAMASEQSAP